MSAKSVTADASDPAKFSESYLFFFKATRPDEEELIKEIESLYEDLGQLKGYDLGIPYSNHVKEFTNRVTTRILNCKLENSRNAKIKKAAEQRRLEAIRLIYNRIDVLQSADKPSKIRYSMVGTGLIDSSTANNAVLIQSSTITISDFIGHISEANSRNLDDNYLSHGKFLILFALTKVNFDVELNWNGHIICISPDVSFNKFASINLSSPDGRNGEHGSEGKWYGNLNAGGDDSYSGSNPCKIQGATDGTAGTSGSAAYPAGHMVVVTAESEEFRNIKTIFKSNGGIGGSGGDGGKGGSCDKKYATRPSCRAGGNGGPGGDASKGGLGGSLSYLHKSKGIGYKIDQVQNNMNTLKGEDGCAGIGGDGGRGWKNSGIIYKSGENGREGVKGGLKKNVLLYDESIKKITCEIDVKRMNATKGDEAFYAEFVNKYNAFIHKTIGEELIEYYENFLDWDE